MCLRKQKIKYGVIIALGKQVVLINGILPIGPSTYSNVDCCYFVKEIAVLKCPASLTTEKGSHKETLKLYIMMELHVIGIGLELVKCLSCI